MQIRLSRLSREARFEGEQSISQLIGDVGEHVDAMPQDFQFIVSRSQRRPFRRSVDLCVGQLGCGGGGVALVHIGVKDINELADDVVAAQGDLQFAIDVYRGDRLFEGARK